MSVSSAQHKSVLQLIGVSCLFTASKIQEIYPPRLSKFAELTDGACTEEQILAKELDILRALQWKLSPITPIAWLEASCYLLASLCTSLLLPLCLHCDMTSHLLTGFVFEWNRCTSKQKLSRQGSTRCTMSPCNLYMPLRLLLAVVNCWILLRSTTPQFRFHRRSWLPPRCISTLAPPLT